MEDDTLDLFADIDEINAILQQCETDSIEILFDARDMVCPISGCKGITFPSKTKFSRHWEERHKLQSMKYLCPVSNCLAECRQKADMRNHIKGKHESNPQKMEYILAKCETVVRENKGYVDPGLYTYRGGTKKEEGQSTQTMPLQANFLEELGVDQQVPVKPEVPESSKPDALSHKKRKMTVEEYRFRETGASSVTTQTSWRDYKPLTVPPLPTDIEELQVCLAWLCNGIDQLGRTRKLAKRRLAEMGDSELQRERQLRREAERKNREMEKEIRRLKESGLWFPEQ